VGFFFIAHLVALGFQAYTGLVTAKVVTMVFGSLPFLALSEEVKVMQLITAHQLKEILKSEIEFAILDVRERNPFSTQHLLLSSCVPLSQLELMIGDLVPRLGTKIVVVNEGAADIYGLDERAAVRLHELGYTDVAILEGGISGWSDAGFELFSGVGSYCKAFGEWIAKNYHTPYVTAPEERRKIKNRANQIILDCRPTSEYHCMTIPGSINAPGADLLYRVHDAVTDPHALVVVHCAGRTRSIIGTQSLVNAGIPNPVAALENGTMGWQLAGFELEYGQTRLAPWPSPEGLARAKECASRVAGRFGVRKIPYDTLKKWMAEGGESTLYVIDVRLPEEFAAGHLDGSRNVPGGQLIQATDECISVFNSRIVLLDDTEVRATMTASWLIQMGWDEVYVLENGITDLPLTQGPYKPGVLGLEKASILTSEELRKRLENSKQAVALVDVASSAFYQEKHIPGAWWGIRSRLGVDLSKLGHIHTLILLSEDGTLAHLAARDLQHQGFEPEILVLDGGTMAWSNAGLPTSTGMEGAVSELHDTWYMPYMHPDAPEQAKRRYLEWEHGLVAQIERDGTAKFRTFPDK
jgi:rhodanese-related sulfurtransferase